MQKTQSSKILPIPFPKQKKLEFNFLANANSDSRRTLYQKLKKFLILKHTQFHPLNFSPVEKLLCHCGTIINFLCILIPVSETNNQNNKLLSLYKFICMSYPIQQSHLSKQQKLFRDDHEQNCCCHYRIPGLIFQRHKLQHSYQNHVCQIFKIEKRTNQVKPFQSRKRGCYQQGASKELIQLKQYDSGFLKGLSSYRILSGRIQVTKQNNTWNTNMSNLCLQRLCSRTTNADCKICLAFLSGVHPEDSICLYISGTWKGNNQHVNK